MAIDYWSRLERTRLGRRTVIATGAVSGAAAFLAACGGGSDSKDAGGASGAQTAVSGTAAVAAQGTPKPGGQMREATITQAPHFSPFHPGADPSYVNFFRREWGYYEQLWALKDIKDSDKLDLRLAASVEQPDETTAIIKLHPSKFQNRPPANGRDVTSEDVVALLKFLTKPPATGGTFLQSGKDYKNATAIDPLTIRYETFGPRAFFFENGGGTREIVPREMLDEQTLKQTIPVGSGPYEYKSHTLGSIEEIKRSESYRNKDVPYIAERKLTFVPDSAAIEAAFRSNQIDNIGFTDIKQRDTIAKDLGNKIVVKDVPSPTGMAIVMNINRPPWNDIRVREAIYRAIDPERAINTIFFGDGQRTWYFSKGSFLRNPLGPEAVQQYIGYDPKKATELLKASGMDLSKEYEFMVPVEAQTWVDSARLFAEDLQKVGLKTRLNPVVRNIYLQRAGPKPGDFDLTMSVLLSYQYAQTNSGTFWDSTSLQDPEVDALVTKIYETVDPKRRDTLSHEFETMLAKKYSNLLPILSVIDHYGWYTYLKGYNDQYLPYKFQIREWLDK